MNTYLHCCLGKPSQYGNIAWNDTNLQLNNRKHNTNELQSNHFRHSTKCCSFTPCTLFRQYNGTKLKFTRICLKSYHFQQCLLNPQCWVEIYCLDDFGGNKVCGDFFLSNWMQTVLWTKVSNKQEVLHTLFKAWKWSIHVVAVESAAISNFSFFRSLHIFNPIHKLINLLISK